VFKDVDHLFTFLKRIENRLITDVAKGDESASELVVCREKRKEKKKVRKKANTVYSNVNSSTIYHPRSSSLICWFTPAIGASDFPGRAREASSDHSSQSSEELFVRR